MFGSFIILLISIFSIESLNVYKEHYCSNWYNKDDPLGPGYGDIEIIDGLNIPYNPILNVKCKIGSVEARDILQPSIIIKSIQDASQLLGQTLSIFNNNGLLCNNIDNPNGGCKDYEVRFCCQPKYAFIDIKTDFNNGNNNICPDNGFYGLAVIKDDSDNNRAAKTCQDNTNEACRIGIGMNFQTNIFYDIDGNEQEYFNWNNGFPSRLGQIDNSVIINADNAYGKWRDWHAHPGIYILCSINEPINNNNNDQLNNGLSPLPEYIRGEGKLSYSEARQWCKDNIHEDSDLVSLKLDYSFDNVLVREICFNGIDDMNGPGNNCWIGLNRTNTNPEWKWIDSSPEYLNREEILINDNDDLWGPGQPDEDVDCVVIRRDTGLGDQPCNAERPFICTNSIRRGYFIPVGNRIYSSAKQICEDRNSELATMTNERDILESLRVSGHDGRSRHVWLGYTAEINSNQFKWLDGSYSSYTNWGTNSPNNNNNNRFRAIEMRPNGDWTDGADPDTRKLFAMCNPVNTLNPSTTPTSTPTTTPTSTPTSTPTTTPTTTPTKTPTENPIRNNGNGLIELPEYIRGEGRLSYSDARQWCKDNIGPYSDLAGLTLNGSFKNELLTDICFNGVSSRSSQYYCWIGLNKINTKPNWEWINSNPQSWINTQVLITDTDSVWASGEPNEQSINAECAVIRRDEALGDQPCNRERPFICTNAINRGYFMPTGNRIYSSAKQICEDNNSVLATITNERDILDAIRVSGHDGRQRHLWIGYTAQENSNQFTWLDGSISLYTNWGINSPNNNNNNGFRAIEMQPQGYWTDGANPDTRKIFALCNPVGYTAKQNIFNNNDNNNFKYEYEYEYKYDNNYKSNNIIYGFMISILILLLCILIVSCYGFKIFTNKQFKYNKIDMSTETDVTIKA